MTSLKGISNAELISKLKKLVAHEQDLTLKILPHLAEVERRGLYLEKGYSSLFEYCRSEFGYSDASAWRRSSAAIAICKCPQAWELLKSKRVTMSALCQVYKIISPGLLTSICGKSKTEIEIIIAALRPRSVHPDRSKPVMVPKKIAPNKVSSLGSATAPNTGVPVSSKNLTSLRREVKLTNVTLSFEQKWKVEGVVSQRVYEKLQQCKKLLSCKYPEGVDYDTLFDELTEVFLNIKHPERRVQKRTKRVRQAHSKTTNTRHIPADIKQAVWKRDKGKCTFVGSNGKRCNSEHNIQFDHHPVPFARGGPSTVNNLRLLCAKHNRYTAERVYGEKHMKASCVRETGRESICYACANNPRGSQAFVHYPSIADRPPPVSC
jgi:5-methylcytosine-specific restriction endonuclease McrA